MFMRKNQNGSVMVIILAAVALFAALSFAVMQTGAWSSGTDKEDAILERTLLLDYATKMQTAAKRLQLVNRCSTIYYYHAANKRCSLVAPEGGNVAPWKGHDPLLAGTDVVGIEDGYPIAGVGTDANDIVFYIGRSTGYGATVKNFEYQACLDINLQQGMPGSAACPQYPPIGAEVGTNTPSDPSYGGHKIFCTVNSGSTCNAAISDYWATFQVVLVAK